MLETIAEKLNFYPNIFYNTTYGAWGTMIMNGSSSGAFDAVKVRNVDLTLGNLNMKIERAIHLGYTLPYASDIFIFIIPPGRALSSFEKLMSPFNFNVWIALCVLLILSFIIIAFLEIQSLKMLRNLIIGPEITSPYMNVFVAVFGVSQRKLPVKNFPRFLLMTFLIFCLILRTLYQGSLFKYLQANYNSKEPETIEEMAQLNYTFYLIFSYYDFTKDNVAMQGKRQFVDPETMKLLMEKGIDPNFQGTIMSKLSEVVYRNHERALDHQELFKICKERYMMVPITMYFPKNSYLVDPFNNVIQYLHASGLMNFWTSINEDIKYLNFDTSSNEPKVLTIEHLSGAFQTWLALCTFSIFVFFIEKINCSRRLY
jgi:ABC-type amino acid transport substrate-binding protein